MAVSYTHLDPAVKMSCPICLPWLNGESKGNGFISKATAGIIRLHHAIDQILLLYVVFLQRFGHMSFQLLRCV